MLTLPGLFRALSLTALLAVSACASPVRDGRPFGLDGMTNHPIAVEPSYQAIRLGYAGGGLAPDDAARLDAFVGGYRDHGNGSIAISAPGNSGARGTIAFFTDRINAMGVPRDHIIVATHDAPDGDTRVEINYISYQAHTDKCGDWSEDLSFTLENTTPRNFGCAVQQNIAAMVADPRDLLAPRPMGPVDANRRVGVMGNYEQGKTTQAEKNAQEQSGSASDLQ